MNPYQQIFAGLQQEAMPPSFLTRGIYRGGKPVGFLVQKPAAGLELVLSGDARDQWQTLAERFNRQTYRRESVVSPNSIMDLVFSIGKDESDSIIWAGDNFDGDFYCGPVIDLSAGVVKAKMKFTPDLHPRDPFGRWLETPDQPMRRSERKLQGRKKERQRNRAFRRDVQANSMFWEPPTRTDKGPVKLMERYEGDPGETMDGRFPGAFRRGWSPARITGAKKIWQKHGEAITRGVRHGVSYEVLHHDDGAVREKRAAPRYS